MQKVLTVYAESSKYGVKEKGLEIVQEHLLDGWKIVSVTAMGGAGAAHSSSGSYESNSARLDVIIGTVFVLSDEDDPIYKI